MNMIDIKQFKNNIANYVLSNRVDKTYQFKVSAVGSVTFYSSCFAVMTLHYCGKLAEFSKEEKIDWASYLNSYQDEDTGYFKAPEIMKGELSSGAHDQEHLLLHLVCHVLPALDLLDAKPKYTFKFAEKFADLNYLENWLSKRDWKSAWLEGNNLLFIGQILLYQFNQTGEQKYQVALDYWFAWLDKEVDENTGLWGTNGYCDKYVAMYGGYHQLLIYFNQKKSINSPNQLIDTVLSTQHFDGGYSPYQGGGTCQDVDAVDILVNMYKRYDYKHREIRLSLRKSVNCILKRLTKEGGFEDRLEHEFIHMGMEDTRTPTGTANMFSTWFTTHTFFLALEIIQEDIGLIDASSLTSKESWHFNRACSMGWHDNTIKFDNKYNKFECIIDAGRLHLINGVMFLYNRVYKNIRS